MDNPSEPDSVLEPDHFREVIPMNEKDLWLISEFLNRQPRQFLYYFIPYMDGKSLFSSKTEMLK